MPYSENPAETNGPNRDGSQSLAKESKVGLTVGFITYAVVDGLVDALNAIDLSGQSGWWVRLAIAGIGTAVGLGSAWLKKNR